MHKAFSQTGLKWLWLALVIILFDQAIKYWALQSLVLLEPLRILPIFNLTLAYNKGAAFSFLEKASGWQNLFLGGLAVIISIVIIAWLAKLPSRERLLSVALCMIVGGAIGNALDRVLYGYVIDYFNFHLGDWHFAIFNFADSMICVGAFLIIIHWMISGKEDRS